MRESYVRPVRDVREPWPAWVAVWRFRLTALLILALLAFGTVKLIQHYQGAGRQDPGLGEPGTSPTAVP